MRALLSVELTRFRWRRAVLLILVAAVVVPGLIFAATAWNTRPVSASEAAEVQRMVEEQRQDPSVQKQLDRCVAKPQRYGVDPSGDVQAACEEMTLPQPEWFSTRQPLDLRTELEQGSLLGVAVVLTMLLLLVGTTFVGHDWNSGSMSNQLLFEPRRARVWAAKGAVVLGTGLLLAGVVLASYWGGLLALAHARDLAVPDGLVSKGYGVVLRGALLAAFAGLGGYALTMLFRSTVATLGVMFAVAIAGPLLITLLGFPGNQRYMPQNNYAAVLFKDTTYYDESACAQSPDGSCEQHLRLAGGTTYFATLLLLAGVPSVLSFRRRDVP
ncbi:ABC transporter permease subunit [Nocardioides sp. KIGAM211]|uniref:ABC transporter permease subunit n=1 Tax=Nocardioides luti TaxID=2761101 RepID=A0A7X0RK46_9ACTN|nr:ABC transporter permease subunit [Nocardioides luti]MBB6629627.1 ABC transporter permease subunit [Nocardioides luti]